MTLTTLFVLVFALVFCTLMLKWITGESPRDRQEFERFLK
jgi:hypothetical protein